VRTRQRCRQLHEGSPPAARGSPSPSPSPPRAPSPYHLSQPATTCPKRQPRQTDLAGPLTIDRAVAVALANNPGLRAAHHRVRSQTLLAEAERKPAGPSLSLDLWQVPLARPYALDQSPMVMLALRQPIPPAGLLKRKAAALAHLADAESADRDVRAQALATAVRHAFIDYAAATARHQLHLDHQAVTDRILQLAQARQSVTGTLLDIARAETEAARALAAVATDQTTIDAARTRLNSLLARPPHAPLGPPVALPDETATADAADLITRARDQRPEHRAAASRRDAAAMELQAARRAANLPAADVGLAFFPATKVMTYNGYGVLVNLSLPWLSGQGRKRRDAAAELAAAASADLEQADLEVASEVAGALQAAQSAARRWVVLRQRALPASQRAREVALSGYEVGRADMLAMLAAEGTYVDIVVELIDVKSELDHALADLDRASGAHIARSPLPTTAVQP
jgi:cobalt-zinc-cadmium efflux system outer membrane protein